LLGEALASLGFKFEIHRVRGVRQGWRHATNCVEKRQTGAVVGY
jgi:hypothetical protein